MTTSRPIRPEAFSHRSNVKEAIAKNRDEKKLIAAVDAFAGLMKAKLIKKAREGYTGWDSADPNHLARLIWEHLEKGDPVDVANLCMMLSHGGHGINISITVEGT